VKPTKRRLEFLRAVLDDKVWVDLLTPAPQHHVRMAGRAGIFDARFREMRAAGLVDTTGALTSRGLRTKLTVAGREVLRAWEES